MISWPSTTAVAPTACLPRDEQIPALDRSTHRCLVPPARFHSHEPCAAGSYRLSHTWTQNDTPPAPLGSEADLDYEEWTMSDQIQRFFAIDLHKSYVVAGAVDSQQQVILQPRRVPLAEFEFWAKKQLRPTDAVVLEAGPNAWFIHDPSLWLAEWWFTLTTSRHARVRNGPTRYWCWPSAVSILPAIWCSSCPRTEALVAHRRRLVMQRTAAESAGVLHRHNLIQGRGSLLETSKEWWTSLPIPCSEVACRSGR